MNFVSPRSVLEVLRRAEARLAGNRAIWRFDNWNSCTCGHIYAAATGRRGGRDEVKASSPTGKYGEVIQQTARALGWQPHVGPCGNLDHLAEDAAIFVSDYTAKGCNDCSVIPRSRGLEVVREAIAKIEAMEEQARLDVLAQTARIVEDAQVDEPARESVAV